jgi:hypothetical protein
MSSKKKEKVTGPLPEVWSCGGGTQSCAIAVLIIQGRLPKPDHAVIADTEYEKQSTWDYYEKYLKPGMAEVGVDLVRLKKSEWTERWAKDVINYTGHVLIPAYSLEEGPVAKLDNICTTGWKVRVIERYLRSKGIRKWRTWLGFSVDEPRRWIKKAKNPLYRLPLVNEVRLRRSEAISLVKRHGWPQPPRSACWMCPNHNNDEWRYLKQYNPKEFQMAVEFERESCAQKIGICIFMRVVCLWIKLISQKKKKHLLTFLDHTVVILDIVSHE